MDEETQRAFKPEDLDTMHLPVSALRCRSGTGLPASRETSLVNPPVPHGRIHAGNVERPPAESYTGSMHSALTTLVLTALTLTGITTTAASPTPSTLAPSMRQMHTLSTRTRSTKAKPKRGCKRGKVLVGVCGSPDSLYPTCNEDFEQACKVSGGSTSSCGPDGSACHATVNCLDNSDLYHACDEKFVVACGRDMGGSFECTGECDDGTCCAGNCSRPDEQ